MTVTIEDVKRVADLARIEVGDADLHTYTDELSRILDLVDEMNSSNTEQIMPLAHPGDAGLRLRADRVSELDQRDALQAVAPAVTDGLYLVPRVIE